MRKKFGKVRNILRGSFVVGARFVTVLMRAPRLRWKAGSKKNLAWLGLLYDQMK